MITGTAAWLLVVVVLSMNKVGYEIQQRGIFTTEEECAYFLDDALKAKSTVVGKCVRIEAE